MRGAIAYGLHEKDMARWQTAGFWADLYVFVSISSRSLGFVSLYHPHICVFR
jgi:hypothetical protein